jgi:hypothetical protein
VSNHTWLSKWEASAFEEVPNLALLLNLLLIFSRLLGVEILTQYCSNVFAITYYCYKGVHVEFDYIMLTLSLNRILAAYLILLSLCESTLLAYTTTYTPRHDNMERKAALMIEIWGKLKSSLDKLAWRDILKSASS